MGEFVRGVPIAGLAAKGKIQPDDVLMLRREVFHDGIATRGEAEALFALDASSNEKCPEWRDFFVEAVSDYAVFSEPPSGHVSPENAAWLRRSITRDGRVDTAGEMELLIVVLEKARSVPAELAAFALQQVADAITDGVGPLAVETRRGAVSDEDLKRLRRILYAAGGEDAVAISHAEADVLFAINEHVVPGANPWFDDLFVKAVASFLLGATGHELPNRAEALASRRSLRTPSPILAASSRAWCRVACLPSSVMRARIIRLKPLSAPITSAGRRHSPRAPRSTSRKWNGWRVASDAAVASIATRRR